MPTQPVSQSINDHYGRQDLETAILDGLRAAGLNPEAITYVDLAPVDHFHIRGREATLELARRAELSSGLEVLDVGGGLGGAAARWRRSSAAGSRCWMSPRSIFGSVKCSRPAPA